MEEIAAQPHILNDCSLLHVMRTRKVLNCPYHVWLAPVGCHPGKGSFFHCFACMHACEGVLMLEE